MIARRWILWYAVTLHLVWAAALLLSARAADATPVSLLHQMGGSVVPLILILASVAAVCSLLHRQPGIGCLLLMMPQQILMLISAGGAAACIMRSAYADGVVRPRAFIFVDQCPAIIAAIMHTLALIEMHAGGLWLRMLYRWRP